MAAAWIVEQLFILQGVTKTIWWNISPVFSSNFKKKKKQQQFIIGNINSVSTDCISTHLSAVYEVKTNFYYFQNQNDNKICD